MMLKRFQYLNLKYLKYTSTEISYPFQEVVTNIW